MTRGAQSLAHTSAARKASDGSYAPHKIEFFESATLLASAARRLLIYAC